MVIYCIMSFVVGILTVFSIEFIRFKLTRKVHEVRRWYPTLSLARDVYNQVAFKLDKECKDFRQISLKIKPNKKMQAFEVICRYEALGDSIFTF